jgi:hypothetical protein
VHVGQEYPWVQRTGLDEGMLVCREAVFAGAVGGRGGGRGSLWATGLRRGVFEARSYQGSRTEVVKEWSSGPWCKGCCSHRVRMRLPSC